MLFTGVFYPHLQPQYSCMKGTVPDIEGIPRLEGNSVSSTLKFRGEFVYRAGFVLHIVAESFEPTHLSLVSDVLFNLVPRGACATTQERWQRRRDRPI